eukprot:GSChrysophyteH1.ASY1.ANO1.2388.1 assembled CDS
MSRSYKLFDNDSDEEDIQRHSKDQNPKKPATSFIEILSKKRHIHGVESIKSSSLLQPSTVSINRDYNRFPGGPASQSSVFKEVISSDSEDNDCITQTAIRSQTKIQASAAEANSRARMEAKSRTDGVHATSVYTALPASLTQGNPAAKVKQDEQAFHQLPVPRKHKINEQSAQGQKQMTQREVSPGIEDTAADATEEEHGIEQDASSEHPSLFNRNDIHEVLNEPLALEPIDFYSLPSPFVNHPCNARLLPHQREGIKWLWNRLATKQGGILADDMGMGKTVMVTVFLNRERLRSDCMSGPPPCLIIVPLSVLGSWMSHLKDWGHFLVEVLRKDAGSSLAERSTAIGDKMQRKRVEVVLTTYEAICNNDTKSLLHGSYEWSTVFYDEGHRLKNIKTRAYQAALSIKSCIRVALTGTAFQNNFKELFAVLNLVTNEKFCSWEIYKEKNSEIVQAKAEEALLENDRIIKKYVLRRTKDDDDIDLGLKMKHEFCVLSALKPIQWEIYEYLLTLPDFENCRRARESCPLHPHVTERMNCCAPYNEIDPRAMVWIQQHREGCECQKCPTCVIFPILHKLRSVYNDPALLQSGYNEGYSPNDLSKTIKRRDFMQNALNGTDFMEKLGGVERPRELDLFHENRNRSVLIFSESTRMLDLIEIQLKHGYGRLSYMRLDGNTPQESRESMCKKFNGSSERVDVFIISSKAGGLGLNLTGATRVIHFDINWNPTVDQQAQDRAYRIGQGENVEVYRLIAKGTLEELIYLRQCYKMSMQRTVMEKQLKLDQVFEGIQGETHGELFGIANMMQLVRYSLSEAILEQNAGQQTDAGEQKGSLDATDGSEDEDAVDADAVIASIRQRTQREIKDKKEAECDVQCVSASALTSGLSRLDNIGEDQARKLAAQVFGVAPHVVPKVSTDESVDRRTDEFALSKHLATREGITANAASGSSSNEGKNNSKNIHKNSSSSNSSASSKNSKRKLVHPASSATSPEGEEGELGNLHLPVKVGRRTIPKNITQGSKGARGGLGRPVYTKSADV